jgi:DNA-binding NtrC family response regulator
MSRPETGSAADAHLPDKDHTRSMARAPLQSGAPVAAQDYASETTGLASERNGRPIRVMVIDDDGRVRAAIGQTIALEADLAMVADAANAAAALALAERIDPSVALVDVLLPEATTGLALVGRLAHRPGWVVVAMSVRSSVRLDALAAGAVAFVEKGDDIDALLDALRVAAAPAQPG